MIDRFTALAAWGKTDRLTQNRVKRLLAFFGSLEIAWEEATETSLHESGISKTECEGIIADMKLVDPQKEAEILKKLGVHILTPDDPLYPSRLSEIASRPEILYLRGTLESSDETAFAVVGSRKISTYGKQIISEIVTPLSRHFTIVSGLATGIDSAAHEAALEAGGRTIAVLGNGIDFIYPSENRPLADRILASGGALLSEFAPGTEATTYNFPRRNRIVSGMSMGVLVAEAQAKSGSLITAQYALEQNREVFAVPGSIFSKTSSGCHHLISKGEAKLVTSAEEILEEFDLHSTVSNLEFRKRMPLAPLEEQIWNLLSHEPILGDELCRRTGISMASLAAQLTMLEMKGMAKQLGHGQWVKN